MKKVAEVVQKIIECLKKVHSIPYLTRIATSLQTYYNVVSCMDLVRLFLFPLWTKFRGGGIEMALSVCPDICLCRFVPAHNFSLLWRHWLTIVGTWVYHHEMMCCVHSWSRYVFNVWPQCQIYRVFDMSLCLASNFFLPWHWLTIIGSWVYLHERMCRVQLWSWYKADL